MDTPTRRRDSIPPIPTYKLPEHDRPAKTGSAQTIRTGFLKLFASSHPEPAAPQSKPFSSRDALCAQPTPKPAPTAESSETPAPGPSTGTGFSLVNFFSIFKQTRSTATPTPGISAQTAKADSKGAPAGIVAADVNSYKGPNAIAKMKQLGELLKQADFAKTEGLFRKAGEKNKLDQFLDNLLAGQPIPEKPDALVVAEAYKRLVKANSPLSLPHTLDLLKAVRAAPTESSAGPGADVTGLASAYKTEMQKWTPTERSALIETLQVAAACMEQVPTNRMTAEALGVAMGISVIDVLNPEITKQLPASITSKLGPAIFAYLLTDYTSAKPQLFSHAEKYDSKRDLAGSDFLRSTASPFEIAGQQSLSSSSSNQGSEVESTSEGTPAEAVTFHASPSVKELAATASAAKAVNTDSDSGQLDAPGEGIGSLDSFSRPRSLAQTFDSLSSTSSSPAATSLSNAGTASLSSDTRQQVQPPESVK